jgi:hypothetical protein
MLRALAHYREHFVNLASAKRLMKQITHRINEDPARLSPMKRRVEPALDQFDFAGPFRSALIAVGE